MLLHMLPCLFSAPKAHEAMQIGLAQLTISRHRNGTSFGGALCRPVCVNRTAGSTASQKSDHILQFS